MSLRPDEPMLKKNDPPLLRGGLLLRGVKAKDALPVLKKAESPPGPDRQAAGLLLACVPPRDMFE